MDVPAPRPPAPATDSLVVALLKLDPVERLGVLELLPEWQKLTKPNELRASVRREVCDAVIALALKAQDHALHEKDPLRGIVWAARQMSAKMRVEENGSVPP